MGLGDILSSSISYPFSDLKKFLMVGISLLIIDLDAILSQIFGQDSAIVLIAFIIAVLFSFVVAGYSVGITKRGIDGSNEILHLIIKIILSTVSNCLLYNWFTSLFRV